MCGAGTRCPPQRCGGILNVPVGGARRLATVQLLTVSATAFTASKSPELAIAKPASMTSTFRRSSARDAQLLVLGHRGAGALLPSRNVVSKMIKRSFLMTGPRLRQDTTRS